MLNEQGAGIRPAFNIKVVLDQQQLNKLNEIMVQAGISRNRLFDQFISDILENKIIIEDKGIIIYESTKP